MRSPVCPRCLDETPGFAAGNPDSPHPGPFTRELCATCNARTKRVTADTITDEQIRELLADYLQYDDGTIKRHEAMRSCVAALHGREAGADDVHIDAARARCAEIWNARHGGESEGRVK